MSLRRLRLNLKFVPACLWLNIITAKIPGAKVIAQEKEAIKTFRRRSVHHKSSNFLLIK
jgi:hypothetical protein